MIDRDLVLLATLGLASVGATISTLEWLANRRQFGETGLLSWKTARGIPSLARSSLRAALGSVLAYPNIVGLFAVRLAALAALPAALLSGRFVAGVLGLVFATTLLVNLRISDGIDGSDQMSTQVFGALFLGYLPGTNLALDAALGYLALQSCLSYWSAGWAKIQSPAWREGSAVLAVVNTRTYGHPWAVRLLSERLRLTRSLAWGAMAVELAFPLVLVVGYPCLLVFLAWGLVFHVLNALVMGFNTFFWSFVATYPAILYCAVKLHG